MSNKLSVQGFHHITAISGDAQSNVDFYAGVLGLRLVKVTVNFDDPTAYHLYYGDGIGTPGTALTFFPYPGGRSARSGNGAFGTTILAIPEGSMGFWEERLASKGVSAIRTRSPFGEESLEFGDVDGFAIALQEKVTKEPVRWEGSEVPFEHAIRGVTTMQLHSRSGSSANFVVDQLGGEVVDEKEGVVRLAIGEGNHIDLSTVDREALSGHGGIHHVALAVKDEAEQEAFHARLYEQGRHVSPVMNRTYFKSIYFREPGGALYEIATLGPGFTVDETLTDLGAGLYLPPQYESHRAAIEANLPRLKLPSGVVVGG